MTLIVFIVKADSVTVVQHFGYSDVVTCNVL